MQKCAGRFNGIEASGYAAVFMGSASGARLWLSSRGRSRVRASLRSGDHARPPLRSGLARSPYRRDALGVGRARQGALRMRPRAARLAAQARTRRTRLEDVAELASPSVVVGGDR